MKKAWLITVDMGYGHQRAAYPLKDLAFEGKIINANNYQGIPEKDRKTWERGRKFYEFISKFKRIPLIGKLAFAIFDEFQKIPPFHPGKDLSKPNLALKQYYSFIKKGWGKDLIGRLEKKTLPLITTFFVPAFMAEFFNYPGQIFCVICDADISRTWAPLKPAQSRIKYFASTTRVVERLKLYGVKSENIFLTGFPLPLENIGSENLEVLKEDLSYRLLNLDPKKTYFKQHKGLLEKHLGKLPEKSNHPLTIMFAVGGAGAQKEIGIEILKSLASKIKEGKVKLILVAGIRKEVKQYFANNIKKYGEQFSANLEVLFERDIESYFKSFNLALRKTDILWTKPSELSFYSGLGLPIIIAPPIGSHEQFNKEWLLKLGSGILQRNPRYTDQWLFDFLDKGILAKAAMKGFVKAEKSAIFKIKEIILKN